MDRTANLDHLSYAIRHFSFVIMGYHRLYVGGASVLTYHTITQKEFNARSAQVNVG